MRAPVATVVVWGLVLILELILAGHCAAAAQSLWWQRGCRGGAGADGGRRSNATLCRRPRCRGRSRRRRSRSRRE